MFLAIYATIMTVTAIIMTLGYIGLYIEDNDTRKKLEKADLCAKVDRPRSKRQRRRKNFKMFEKLPP